jgi:hypothetical protein
MRTIAGKSSIAVCDVIPSDPSTVTCQCQWWQLRRPKAAAPQAVTRTLASRLNSPNVQHRPLSLRCGSCLRVW